MAEPPTMQAALRSLAGPRIRVTDGQDSVPHAPGLYAIHGEPAAWTQLGLGAPPDDRPLYVGKSERSLDSRDVGTHFVTGKTGSSTVRRSLAGLLAVDLDLRGRPRNPARPERFANFGLESAGDARLTQWMLEHLQLAVWASPPRESLDPIETAVLNALVPPLNLDKVVTPWRALVRAGRRGLADEARTWASSSATDRFDF